MYLYCQKCATVVRATPHEIEQHTTWYHMHNNAWWPLQYVTTADAMVSIDHGAVRMGTGDEPTYTQQEVDARRSTREVAQNRTPLSAQVEPTPGAPDVDWDYELSILLKEGK